MNEHSVTLDQSADQLEQTGPLEGEGPLKRRDLKWSVSDLSDERRCKNVPYETNNVFF